MWGDLWDSTETSSLFCSETLDPLEEEEEPPKKKTRRVVPSPQVAAWEAQAPSELSSRRSDLELEQFLKQVHGTLPWGYIIELGCGAGNQIPLYRELGRPFLGLDISSTLVEEAERRHGPWGQGEGVIQKDVVESWEFGDIPIALVVDVRCLTYQPIPKMRSTLTKIAASLEPGGWYFGKYWGEQTTRDWTGFVEPHCFSMGGHLQKYLRAAKFDYYQFHKLTLFSYPMTCIATKETRGKKQVDYQWACMARVAEQ